MVFSSKILFNLAVSLFIQVYTIDRFTLQQTVTGYTAMKIFVETGTNRQPTVDKGGIQVMFTPFTPSQYNIIISLDVSVWNVHVHKVICNAMFWDFCNIHVVEIFFYIEIWLNLQFRCPWMRVATSCGCIMLVQVGYSLSVSLCSMTVAHALYHVLPCWSDFTKHLLALTEDH